MRTLRTRRLARRARWAFALGLFTTAVSAETRGWLRFADGNVASGVLIAEDASGGTFRSDRFGEIHFMRSDAAFEAAPAPPAPPTGFVPDTWSLALSADLKNQNGDEDLDLALDVGAKWERDQDDVALALRSEYAAHNDRRDRNTQSGRLRWYHEIDRPWLVMTQVYAQRDQNTLGSLTNLDYLLAQGTVGFGARLQWSADNYSRVVLGYNRLLLDVFNLNVRFYVSAQSLLFDNSIKLSERATLTNWVNFYYWEDHDTGWEAETEFDFLITRRLSVGALHRYNKNGVSLSDDTLNEFRLFTKFKF